ncbi:DUF5701 family protein [Streptomyces sp. S186]|uniref:DUF5701 family protein n=1 Tax=Streptomyces sp. S186 TaxID=3434395 RepID=UPI003F6629E9
MPNDAMETIAGRGRTLLTIEEGVALVTHHPQVPVKNRCFSLGGSRSGDRRVPAIWISRRAPKLGWCWEVNPHTWLGMASAAARRTAGQPVHHGGRRGALTGPRRPPRAVQPRSPSSGSSSTRATARVQPAPEPTSFTGKQLTV